MSVPRPSGREGPAGDHRRAGHGGPDRLVRVIDALAEVFADLSAADAVPGRTIIEHGSHGEHGDPGPRRQLLAGTAVWERRGVGSVKITTLTPDNPDRGLP
ncbi:hypothetical protein SAZ11_56350 [Streptomyces sp. FXJ1.4098]|nr:hypothetical protein [Streptomyces sp. FXJ1.4098]